MLKQMHESADLGPDTTYQLVYFLKFRMCLRQIISSGGSLTSSLYIAYSCFIKSAVASCIAQSFIQRQYVMTSSLLNRDNCGHVRLIDSKKEDRMSEILLFVQVLR